MSIYNMEARWVLVGALGSQIVEITQPPMDTFAVCALTKTHAGSVGGGGGFCGISQCNGDDLSDDFYPPAHFRRQMTSISFGVVAEGAYAQAMITLFRP